MSFANPTSIVVAIGPLIAGRASVVPGPKPRLHLPYREWPAGDRMLWEHAFGQDDPFAAIRLARASRDRCLWSWRRYLGFLANNEPEALELEPADRLTVARVKPFVAHLATTNAPSSVAAVVEGLIRPLVR
jgi:hypothetical protein